MEFFIGFDFVKKINKSIGQEINESIENVGDWIGLRVSESYASLISL